MRIRRIEEILIGRYDVETRSRSVTVERVKKWTMIIDIVIFLLFGTLG